MLIIRFLFFWPFTELPKTHPCVLFLICRSIMCLSVSTALAPKWLGTHPSTPKIMDLFHRSWNRSCYHTTPRCREINTLNKILTALWCEIIFSVVSFPCNFILSLKLIKCTRQQYVHYRSDICVSLRLSQTIPFFKSKPKPRGI